MSTLLRLVVIVLIIAVTKSESYGQRHNGSSLTLSMAKERALERNPTLKAAEQRIRIAQGQVLQARLMPNPEIAWEGEEVSGDRGGFGEAEHSLTISQVIELGGKRSSRIASAHSAVDVSEAEFHAVRLELLAAVASRYTDVMVIQRQLALMLENIRLAEQVKAAAQEKVNAGAAPRVEAIRSDVAVSNARLDSAEAYMEWVNAKSKLAAIWGEAEPDFDSVESTLPEPRRAPDASQLIPLLENNPIIRQWGAKTQRARSHVRLARAQAIPDLTITAGPKIIAPERAQTFVFGLSIPIPIFARNQGGIAGELSAATEAEWTLRQEETRLQTELVNALGQLNTAFEATETMRDEILPAATTVFEEIQRGYGEGRFDYIDLLASEQDLITARMRHLQLLSSYHQRRIVVERIIGTALADTGETNAQ